MKEQYFFHISNQLNPKNTMQGEVQVLFKKYNKQLTENVPTSEVYAQIKEGVKRICNQNPKCKPVHVGFNFWAEDGAQGNIYVQGLIQLNFYRVKKVVTDVNV